MKLFLAFVVCFTNYHVVLASDPKLNVLRSGTPNLIFEGETVNVSCTVTNAQEVPDIVWLLDFKRIRSNENQLIDTKKSGTNASSILTLRTVTSGQYNKKIIYCKDTENDESSLPKKLTIGTIRVSSSGGDFPKYGDDVILTCSLTEGVAGDVGYLLWREIPSKKILKKSDNEASLQLQLKQVTETEARIYECVCNTRTGYSFFINKTTEIKVSPANTGKKQKEVLFKIGQMVNLTCDVRGYPLNILWKKNCASISSESDIDNKHTLANSNRTLVIMETDSQTQGMYCCIGSNEGGRAKQMFILNRAISPSNPGKEKKEISFKIGQMVNLTCDVRGYPLNILWKKNCLSNCSESDIDNKHTLANSNRTLVIMETDFQTQGMYCCIGLNKGGRANQTFILNRAISPSNPGKEKKEISFKIGQMVNLTCDVRGYPLNILWKKNCLSNCSENIFNNHTMVNSNRTLIITETNSQTQGTYCCIGWNDDGRAVQVFILKPDGRYTNDGIRLKSGLSSLILLVVFNHVFK